MIAGSTNGIDVYSDIEIRIANHMSLLKRLLLAKHIQFRDLVPSNLPIGGGIYRITKVENHERVTMYIGESSNLQERVYRNHLMGNKTSANLKSKLIRIGLCLSLPEAKMYLRKQCQVQFIEIINESERTFFEHFAIAVLEPEYND